METKEIVKQMKIRVKNDLDYFHGKIPERFVVAWRAYLTGMAEWNVIDQGSYGEIVDMLPKVSEPDPIESILLGRE